MQQLLQSLSKQSPIPSATLIIALMIGLAAHALAKVINAALTGGYKFALAFIPAQIIHNCVNYHVLDAATLISMLIESFKL